MFLVFDFDPVAIPPAGKTLVSQAVFVLASACGDLLTAAIVEPGLTTKRLVVYDVVEEGCPSPGALRGEQGGGGAQ